MGQITFGGIASGLDTNAIISALVTLERRPIDLLGTQKSTEQSKLSLYGTLEGLVKSLQTKAQELTSDFFAYELSTSSQSTANITLSSGAQSGSHTLEVSSLAAADRHTFVAVPDPTVGLGAGTITFDYESDPETAGQESHTVTIAAGTDSLNDIAASINSQVGDAVTASVINVGTTVNPSYQLVLAGNDTGADYTIDNLVVSGPSLTYEAEVTAASNAAVKLDGIDIVRSSNVFSDVLAGVSFTVNELTGATPVTFTIDADPEGIKENIQGFVDAYNKVIDFINEQSEFDPDTGPGGDLFGESSLRTIQSTIQGALLDVDLAVVQADLEGYSTLSLVGVDLSADGRLSIDDSTLDAKIKDNLELFADLFIEEDDTLTTTVNEDGLLRKLDDAIELMIKDRDATDPVTGEPILNPSTNEPIQLLGIFNSRRGVINQIVEDIDDQVERLERHVEGFEEDLILRFSRLESVMSGLQAQSQYLSFGLGIPTS